jgi:hypothetical protein
MKPFMKKIMMPALFAALVLFSVSERSAFVHRLLSYVYSPVYYLASSSDGPDCAADMTGQYWVLAREYAPVADQYGAAAFQVQSRRSSDADGELLFMVVEITEACCQECTDVSAAEGHFHDNDFVLFCEGEMQPTRVLWLKPIEGTGFIFNGGLHEIARE